MRKYFLYLALPFLICLFSCDPQVHYEASPNRQKLKENVDTLLDSIQIKSADAELKKFLKGN